MRQSAILGRSESSYRSWRCAITVLVPRLVRPANGGAVNLQPLGLAAMTVHFSLAPPGGISGSVPTHVTLFDQGLTQVLEASVTGLAPGHAYVLALSTRADGAGSLQPLARFTTNPAGAAIVNAVGPIRQIVQGEVDVARRYLVIAPDAEVARPAQVQVSP